jgi:hypothetical protein
MIGIRFCPVSAARARGIVAGRAKNWCRKRAVFYFDPAKFQLYERRVHFSPRMPAGLFYDVGWESPERGLLQADSGRGARLLRGWSVCLCNAECTDGPLGNYIRGSCDSSAAGWSDGPTGLDAVPQEQGIDFCKGILCQLLLAVRTPRRGEYEGATCAFDEADWPGDPLVSCAGFRWGCSIVEGSPKQRDHRRPPSKGEAHPTNELMASCNLCSLRGLSGSCRPRISWLDSNLVRRCV